MRLLEGELADPKALDQALLEFARQFGYLAVPLAPVLLDTVLVLRALTALSDKVLPLRCYFVMTQDMQRSAYLAKALAAELVKSLPCDTPRQVSARETKAAQIEAELRLKGVVYLAKALAAEQIKSPAKAPVGKAVASKKRQEELIAESLKQALATEDVFMIACAFLDVEIAKLGSIDYLKGESPVFFKESKKNRNPLDLTSESVLKDLSRGLHRPDHERGLVERSQIGSGFNHLVRLNALYLLIKPVIHWIKDGEAKGQEHLRRKIDVRKHFNLTHTDYERLITIARREGLITLRDKKVDRLNRYSLRAIHHQRITDYAASFGHTPQRTLNKLLDDFFSLLDKRRKKSALTDARVVDDGLADDEDLRNFEAGKFDNEDD